MSTTSVQEIEEERRLLYVAITRAKKYCMLSYAATRFHNGQTKTCQPSRFIADIDRRYLRADYGRDIAAASSSQENYRTINRFESLRKPAQQSDKSSYPTPLPSHNFNQMTEAGDFKTHSSNQLSVGMKIEHQRFGRGTILEIDQSQPDHRIVVDFSNVSNRTLLLKFARFKIIG